jgi:hypothetical protein
MEIFLSLSSFYSNLKTQRMVMGTSKAMRVSTKVFPLSEVLENAREINFTMKM